MTLVIDDQNCLDRILARLLHHDFLEVIPEKQLAVRVTQLGIMLGTNQLGIDALEHKMLDSFGSLLGYALGDSVLACSRIVLELVYAALKEIHWESLLGLLKFSGHW